MPKTHTFTPTEQAFIDKALATIELDPQKRINKPARDVIDRNNFVFDAHAHIFDGHCVEADYVVIRMLKLEDNPIAKKLMEFIVSRIIRDHSGLYDRLSPAELLEAIYAKKAGKNHFFADDDLKPFESDPEKEGADEKGKMPSIDWIGLRKRLKEILAILNNGKMRFVYDYFEEKAIHNHFPGKELISVQLGMDLESGWKGSVLKDFQRQTDELLDLSTKVPILPYFPVHPDRVKHTQDASGKPYEFNELYDTFLRCFKAGGPVYNGVKCYPSLGYLPGDKALAPIYEICEKAGIPIVTHCGGEIVSTFDEVIHANEFGKPITISESSRGENARALNEPRNWTRVLEEFPELHLDFGHFGGDVAWDQSEHAPHARVKLIVDLMNKYNHVYADFSFNFSNKKVSRIFADYLKSDDPDYTQIKRRAMFGTDFWVVVPMSDLDKDQKKFKQLTNGYHEALFVDNVMRFLGLKHKELIA